MSITRSRCSSGIWPIKTGRLSGTSKTSIVQERSWIVSRTASYMYTNVGPVLLVTCLLVVLFSPN